LNSEELQQHEPHVRGVAALWVRETGIIDYVGLTQAFAREVQAQGGSVQLNSTFLGLKREGPELILETTTGPQRARTLIACAGLHSDRVAMKCGIEPGVRIVPFRGEYYELCPHAEHLCRNLIYPVPDPSLPFLGVHFTRMAKGGVECGPNAVLAFRREGYRFRDASLRDLWELSTSLSFWKMAAKFWRHGLGEMHRSLSPHAFWKALTKLIPTIRPQDLVRAGAGVRAQALGPDGKLVDDFLFRGAERMIHVLNAPSPAATASLSIGQTIAEKAAREFGLVPPPSRSGAV
jgi:L-2-hydroxyglutarate oxidase